MASVRCQSALASFCLLRDTMIPCTIPAKGHFQPCSRLTATRLHPRLTMSKRLLRLLLLVVLLFRPSRQTRSRKRHATSVAQTLSQAPDCLSQSLYSSQLTRRAEVAPICLRVQHIFLRRIIPQLAPLVILRGIWLQDSHSFDSSRLQEELTLSTPGRPRRT